MQLPRVNSRGKPLSNIKVKCVQFIERFLGDLTVVCIRYDWTGASFQIPLSVAKLYVENLSTLKSDRMTVQHGTAEITC